MTRKIAVFTSIRSEYGHLNYLLNEFKNYPQFEIQLIVAGAHLSKKYGLTIDEISKDGHKIFQKMPFLYDDDEPDNLVRSMSSLMFQVGSYFTSNMPDLAILIGDRMELLPIATSALIMSIPIAHISGGEITEGAIDNQIRNSISKISHIHFTAAKQFKENLIKMGEEDWRICVSGELGLDNLNNVDLIEKVELYNDLGLSLDLPLILITFHPETINNKITIDFLSKLLIQINNKFNFQLLVTGSNFDKGGSEINELFEQFSTQHKNIRYISSLGKKRYFSVLKYCYLVIGNSSSGIVEVQSFNKPVINIGKRQQGRLANPNVLNLGYDIDEIIESIQTVYNSDFTSSYMNKQNLYSSGNAAMNIIDYLLTVNFEMLNEKKSQL